MEWEGGRQSVGGAVRERHEMLRCSRVVGVKAGRWVDVTVVP